jgi:alginate O-acetyltransferase complex protein AlgI
MLFHTPDFLFYFLPAALLLHRAALTGSRRTYGPLPRLCLLFATLVFYGWEHPWWLLPFAVSVGGDFVWSALLVRTEGDTPRRMICTASVVQNLGLLAYFKYWDAVVMSVARWGPASAQWLHPHGLVLPAGISFYTFESLSFVIDVYRRDIVPPRNPLDFFGFIAMFPRFIAGPIVRYRDMSAQFHDYRGMRVGPGLTLFVRGLFLKLCFADSFAFFTGYITHAPERIDATAAWVGSLAYAMQIYFDFSGYSLMAIGLGTAFGFSFPDNFRRPYLAASLQDFWRRWHISLSSWLRDYVYRPLGGNRANAFITYRNVFLTMLLGGLWHGAALKYVAWGAWHGAFLCAERAFGWHQRPPSALGWLRTFLVVVTGWVFFFAADITQALSVLRQLVLPQAGREPFSPDAMLDNPLTTALCVAGLVYCFVVEPWLAAPERPREPTGSFREQLVSTCLLAAALVLGLSQFSIPFLYFQF